MKSNPHLENSISATLPNVRLNAPSTPQVTLAFTDGLLTTSFVFLKDKALSSGLHDNTKPSVGAMLKLHHPIFCCTYLDTNIRAIAS